jgi:uncharacterized protein DUF1877
LIGITRSEDVRKVAQLLSSVTPDQIRSGYKRIDPHEYGLPPSDEDLAYTLDYFSGLYGFWRKAAESNRSVIFTASQ